MSTEELNAVLQRVIDRSEAQKIMRMEKMREELVGYGYSIVTTEWLNEVHRTMPLAGIRKAETK